MASLTVTNGSLFDVGQRISIFNTVSTWPKWMERRIFWRYRWVRKILDWKYPPRQVKQDFTITAISGDTLEV